MFVYAAAYDCAGNVSLPPSSQIAITRSREVANGMHILS